MLRHYFFTRILYHLPIERLQHGAASLKGGLNSRNLGLHSSVSLVVANRSHHWCEQFDACLNNLMPVLHIGQIVSGLVEVPRATEYLYWGKTHKTANMKQVRVLAPRLVIGTFL